MLAFIIAINIQFLGDGIESYLKIMKLAQLSNPHFIKDGHPNEPNNVVTHYLYKRIYLNFSLLLSPFSIEIINDLFHRHLIARRSLGNQCLIEIAVNANSARRLR